MLSRTFWGKASFFSLFSAEERQSARGLHIDPSSVIRWGLWVTAANSTVKIPRPNN
jgi:hypothetical protein